MRHEKMSRAVPRPVTPQRLKAAERALRRERESLPLFADDVAGEQPTPEERIERHEEEQVRHWQSIRDHRARTWREARRILRSLPADQQAELLERWNTGPWPARSEYFADFIRRNTGA